MDDRYEILGELGKGGLGAVFKGYDRNLKREVAIKRILPGADEADREAGLKQLTEEAENLCALQHPHIVTVYDVGSDKEGPFVVMELLTGNTLEELVENGPLTWADFRELALQTQEALIAAQEHHLVHRDIKPGNVMLTWLPSGKFQAKLVDFGLAKFSPRPTMQEIGEDDSVFGSIFFMAPEQFERKPLDARTDMYATGCVFYHALAGAYPFDGTTGQEVMQAHLQHTVKPLHEVREDIPRWASDWVMWHMNRDPADRPTDAREALQQFIINEQVATQSQMPEQPAPDPLESKRRKLIIPGTTPAATPATPAAPANPTAHAVPATPVEPAPAQPAPPAPPAQPAPPTPPAPPAQAAPAQAPPAQALPAQPLQAQPLEAKPVEAVPVQPATPAEPPPPAAVVPAEAIQAAEPKPDTGPQTARPEPKPTSPQPLQPPAGSRPSVHDAARKATSSVDARAGEIPTVALTPAQAKPGTALLAESADAANVPIATAQAVPVDHIGDAVVGEAHDAHKKKRKKLSPAITAAIATVLGLLAVLLGYLLLDRMGKNRRVEIYNALVAQTKVEGVTEILVDEKQVRILLDAVSGLKNTEREALYQTLYLSKATDGTDIDQKVAEEATKELMVPDIRKKLFKVLELRSNPAVIPALLEYAAKADKPDVAAAALEACKEMAGDEHFADFLGVLETTEDINIRRSTETTISEIIERSKNRPQLADQLISAYKRQLNEANQHALLRLLGYTGTDAAREKIMTSLESENKLEKQAAVLAIGNWPDDSMFEALINFMGTTDDEQFRSRAFKTCYNYLRYKKSKRTTEEAGQLWKLLAGGARTEGEKKGVINSMPQLEGNWRIPLLRTFLNDESDRVIDDAERAIDYLDGDAEEEEAEPPKPKPPEKKATPKKKAAKKKAEE